VGLTFLLGGVVAQASDASEFSSLGFSADGSYYAFAQTGVSDGSGFSYAEVAVIEVNANRLLKVVHKEYENKTELETLDRALAEIKLARYGIQPGRHPGEVLIDRPNRDLSTVADTVFSLSYWPQGASSNFVPKYFLNIHETANPENGDSFCATDPYSSQKMSLFLTGPSSSHIFERKLQVDEKLPASRGLCPHAYRIRHVIVYKSKLVVGVQYARLGFEGPDQRHLVVTADIPEWK
jgi:predicted secreted protein